jgi:hypothetical protein
MTDERLDSVDEDLNLRQCFTNSYATKALVCLKLDP